MELLAPAGSFDAAVAAVQAGADAIYIGGKNFSARRGAKNFTDEEIAELVKYCHLHGTDVHVAANILVKPSEEEEFIRYVGFLNSLGIDALIIQDIGMAKIIREIYPDLPLHASTQMTAASLSHVKYLEDMGFSRVVLARELSKEEILYICKNSKIEIEAFVHGAICMSYSGQCLMSSIIGARSGNRGMCAQPCRLPYTFKKDGKVLKEGYILSPKDMSLVENIKDLAECGVSSLKIEGRLKRPEYVASVVGVYRKYIDTLEIVTDEDKKILKNSFSRSGFTNGYFTGKTGSKMMSYKIPGNTSQNFFSKEIQELCNSGKDTRKRRVKIECVMRKGKKLYIKITDKEGFSAEAESDVLVEEAINKPMDEERLKEQLSKLGASVFLADSIKVELDGGITIAVKEINATRRKAVERLTEEILKRPKRRKFEYIKDNFKREYKKPELTAQVTTEEQLKTAESLGIKVIYIPKGLIEKAKNPEIFYVVILPEICDSDLVWDIPSEFGVLISNPGQEILYKNHKKYGGTRLNVANSATADVFSHYESVDVSLELNLHEIKNVNTKASKEVMVYGKIPLMIMKNCPVKAISGECSYNKNFTLEDRKKEEFSFSCDGACHSILLNSKNIYMADKLKDITDAGIERLKLVFRDESKEETRKIIKEYKSALLGEKVSSPKENTFTRGHFYRGVL